MGFLFIKQITTLSYLAKFRNIGYFYNKFHRGNRFK